MQPVEPQPSARWYCIVTNPNCQRRAEAELAAKGYRVFWPKERRWATHARAKIAKEYPLIWRYVFVEIGEGQSFGEVRSVNGVERFVGEAGKPEAIDSAKVEEFLHRYMRGEWDFVTTEPCPYWDAEAGEERIRINTNTFPRGARVRVMDGPLADVLATVLGRKHGKLQLMPRGNAKMATEWPSNVRAA